MASKTNTVCGLVIKKTRLGEADLIITLLLQDGSQFALIAKGARKPKSIFSSHFELFNMVEVLYSQGRGLPIAKETRLVEAILTTTSTSLAYVSAQCVAELALKLSRPDLQIPRFFALTVTALSAISNADDQIQITNVAAYFVKATAMSGLQPCLNNCVECGCDMDPSLSIVNFSYGEGGVLCSHCALTLPSINVGQSVINLASRLLRATFSEINNQQAWICSFGNALPKDSFDVCELFAKFITSQMGIRIKSLGMLNVFL
jgi:DNA repair protein RecO (recombination protein O)